MLMHSPAFLWRCSHDDLDHVRSVNEAAARVSIVLLICRKVETYAAKSDAEATPFMAAGLCHH